jgi:hypothetical protein
MALTLLTLSSVLLVVQAVTISIQDSLGTFLSLLAPLIRSHGIYSTDTRISPEQDIVSFPYLFSHAGYSYIHLSTCELPTLF